MKSPITASYLSQMGRHNFSFFLVLGLLGVFGLLTVAGPQLLWSADFNADVSIDSKITLIQDAGSGPNHYYERLRTDNRLWLMAERSLPLRNQESLKIKERGEFLQRLVADLVAQRLSLVDFTKELERYDVHVVQPGESYSKELRSDYSRYFPQLDGDRVVGGEFG